MGNFECVLVSQSHVWVGGEIDNSPKFLGFIGWVEARPAISRILTFALPVPVVAGDADDIARGVLFLVGDDAGFITGSTLSINGGQHMY